MERDVTDFAKAFMGEDVVESAIVIDCEETTDKSVCENTGIFLGSDSKMIIVFKNGKKIKVWASEWGGIGLA